MNIDSNQYHIKKERLWNGVIQYTCTPHLQDCSTCKTKVKQENITSIKYPLVSDGIRHMVSKLICNKCYPAVKEILDNNPYK